MIPAGRRRNGPRNVVAGSVWESRMKIDEVKGGIKVFNDEENSEEGSDGGGGFQVKRNQSGGVREKRKTWKSEPVEVMGRNPIQIKKHSVSVDGIEKNPNQIRKVRSDSQKFPDDLRKELSVSVDGIEKNPLQIRKPRSDSQKFSASVDGIEKNPIQKRRPRFDSQKFPDGPCKELSASVDGSEKNPIQLRKSRSDSQKVPDETCKEFGVCREKIISSSLSNVGLFRYQGLVIDDDGVEDEGEEDEEVEEEIEKKSFDVKEVDTPEQKPENVVKEEKKKLNQIHEVPIPTSANVIKQPPKVPDHPVIDSDLNKPPPIAVSDKFERFSETQNRLQDIGEFEFRFQRPIQSLQSANVKKPSPPILDHPVIDPDLTESPPIGVPDEFERFSETQNSLQNVGEFRRPIQSLQSANVKKPPPPVLEHPVIGPNLKNPPPIAVPDEFEKFSETQDRLQNTGEFRFRRPIQSLQSANVKKPPPPVVDHPVIDPNLKTPPPNEFERFSETQNRLQNTGEFRFRRRIQSLQSANVKKSPPPVLNHPVIDSNLTKPPPIAVSDEFERFPKTQNRLQNIADLVMWRDVSKSAFVFGLGTFILVSSSFTKDLNFSLISAVSYMGFLYLAAIFLYKSFLNRGAIDLDDSNQIQMMGEEEAIWLLKLILPYLNEFFLTLRGLFSGDPATTMKLAVLLYILARCGSSITIWKMAKLGFFGVFTVPKICSSYSTQLTGYGKFWVRRFRDAWDSCSHKKAVIAAIFTLVWNLSSIVARTWAVFMLIVAVRYYQQSLSREEWGAEEVGEQESMQGGRRGQSERQERGPTLVEIVKEKKGS